MIGNFLQIMYYASLVIVIFGLVGNSLMFIVYSKRRSLKKLSISLYYRSMALINLLCTINWIRVFFIFAYGYRIEAQSELLCKSITYLIYVVSPISNWHSVAVSIDRMTAIVFPKRFSLLHKTEFQIFTIFVLYAFNLAYYSFLLVDQKFIEGGPSINNTSSSSFQSNITYCATLHPLRLFIMDVCQLTLVPFVIMMIASVVTIVCLVKVRRKASRRVHTRDVKFGVMAISLNIMFLVLSTPNSFVKLILFYVDGGVPYLATYIGFLLLALFYSNYAFCFFLQLLVNSLVRDQFFKLFRRRINRIGLFSR